MYVFKLWLTHFLANIKLHRLGESEPVRGRQ
jgi:hypothetical protein